MKARLSLDAYVAGVRAGDRAVLGQAITLVESGLPQDRALAAELLQALAAEAPNPDVHRVGITGVPGVGKSTFIESLGQQRTALGERVAVLSIDPSSTRSGGSILGDKTRMQELARDPLAFVRPSPTRGSLGGVARSTRETMRLCEAAGYQVIIVETVGVGQSEIRVADMVDIFVVLMLPGAGDELQGIKRGVLEVADLLAVNKADGANETAARLARAQYARALKLMQPKSPHWRAKALMCSGLSGAGLAELWAEVLAHRDALRAAGVWEAQRFAQREAALRRAFEHHALAQVTRSSAFQAAFAEMSPKVRSGELPVSLAVDRLLATVGLQPERETHSDRGAKR